MTQVNGKSLALSTAILLLALTLLGGVAYVAIKWFWTPETLEVDQGAIHQVQETCEYPKVSTIEII